MLNESEDFEARELAALVASKVYYHIGSFKSAMIYALAAGKLFNIEEDSEFVRTLTCAYSSPLSLFPLLLSARERK